MFEEHITCIRHSLKRAEELSSRAALGAQMFELFFARYPETRSIFANTNLEDFASVKFRYVSELILDSVKHPEYVEANMVSEVHRHQYFDVNDVAYYYGMIDACRMAVQQTLKAEWTPETNTYWDEVTQATKASVQQAYKEVR